jgi:DNA (cytosine-5)-methyltransferase 1
MVFDAKWGVLGANDIGANHQRDRIWIVAKQRNILSHALYNWFGRRQQQQESIEKTIAKLADSTQHRIQSKSCKTGKSPQWSYSSSIGDSRWWSIEPNVGRVVNGVASRVDRLKAIGNGQVPLCAATAWRILNDF